MVFSKEGTLIDGKPELKAIGWDFEPILAPLFIKVGKEFKPSPNDFFIIRSDNSKILSQGYTVRQNYFLNSNKDFLDQLIKAFDKVNFSFVRGGILKEGRYVWIIGKSNKNFKLKNEDELIPMVFINICHDGANIGNFQCFLQRIKCNNIFYGGGEFREKIDIRTETRKENIDDILKQFQQKKVKNTVNKNGNKIISLIEQSLGKWKTKLEIFNQMAACQVPSEKQLELSKEILGIHAENEQLTNSEKKKLSFLLSGIRNEKMGTEGKTLWDIMNAFTGMITHRSYYRSPARIEDFFSANFAERENRVYNFLVEHIK